MSLEQSHRKISNIWAVGRNYKDHAQELNNEVPKTPLVFLKAGSCARQDEDEIVFPVWTTDLHHEVELALRFDDYLNIDAIGIALDLTARDTQNEAKKNGLPWTMAKSFRGSCPLSPFFQVESLEDFSDETIQLEVNGEVRQSARVGDTIFSFKTLIDHVLEFFPVVPGDLLLTGTPKGVGSLYEGDQIVVRLGEIITKSWVVTLPKNI